MKKLSAFIGTGVLISTAFAAQALAAETAGHGAEAGSGGLPQFDPTWFASQIFWLAAAFAFLYFFFATKTLPEISSVIENRRNHIRSDLDMAEKLTADAEKVQETYEEGLEKARAEADEAIQSVDDAMKKKAASEYEAFRQRSEAEILDAEDRIRRAKASAMDDMNTIAAEVASVAVKKIIGASTDVQKAKSIVESLAGKAEAA